MAKTRPGITSRCSNGVRAGAEAVNTTTITKGVDANGNEITRKDSYREGVAAGSESHTTTMTDPDGGTTTTRSKTTTKQE